MALRCGCVIRGMSIPCVVDFISRSEDAFGVVVPMPALPVEGNVLVCALPVAHKKIAAQTNPTGFIFFIVDFLWIEILLKLSVNQSQGNHINT